MFRLARHSNKSRGYSTVIAIAFIGLLFGFGTMAQENNTQDAATASGIPRGVQVSPIRFESDLVPGQSWSGTINLKNFSDKEKILYISAENFVVTADTQSASFYPSGDTRHLESPDIIDWVNIPQKTITLAPKEAKPFSFSVHVPYDAPTGGYYGALFFLIPGNTIGTEATAQIGVNSRMGVLLLFRIKGNEPVRIEGSIEKFSATQDIYLRAPATFNTIIHNKGNLHFRGEGKIVISRFGREVYTIIVPSRVNYPNKMRTYTKEWDFGTWSFGKYTATLFYKSMSGLVTLDAQDTFWVIPWIPVAIIIGIVLILWGAGKFILSHYDIKKKE